MEVNWPVCFVRSEREKLRPVDILYCLQWAKWRATWKLHGVNAAFQSIEDFNWYSLCQPFQFSLIVAFNLHFGTFGDCQWGPYDIADLKVSFRNKYQPEVFCKVEFSSHTKNQRLVFLTRGCSSQGFNEVLPVIRTSGGPLYCFLFQGSKFVC